MDDSDDFVFEDPPPRPPQTPARSADDARHVDLEKLPRCPDCGYILYKLTEMRCPECGRPVRSDDLKPWIARGQRALRRQAYSERLMIIAGAALILTGITMVWAQSRRVQTTGACFVVPLVGLTLVAIGYRIACGDSVHGWLVVFGILWLVGGLLALLG